MSHAASALGILAVMAFLLYRVRRYTWRSAFGVVSCLFFFFLGGVLWQLADRRVEASWSKQQQLYTGVVETIPVERGKTRRAEVTTCGHRILLYWIPDSIGEPLQCGNKIAFYTRIRPPEGNTFFSNFDYGRYLKHQGISGTAFAFAGNVRGVGHEERFSLSREALRWRARIIDLYRAYGFAGDELAVVSALTVGDMSEITPELRAVYNATGASHVLSLSGMHIAILAAILMLLLKPLQYIKGGKRIRMLLVLTLLWAFAVLSGLSAPVMRAVSMFSLYAIAVALTGNRMPGFAVLTVTAFFMLIYRPFYLFDVGFQLSFVAVASILLFYEPVRNLVRVKNRALRYVWEVVALSLVAQLGTSPFILLYFGTFPTYFLLSNLLVAPLAFFILAASVAFLSLFAVPYVGAWAAQALHLLVKVLNDSMAWVQQLSGSQLTAVYITEFQTLLCFLLLGSAYTFFCRRRPVWLCGMLICIIALSVSQWYRRQQSEPGSLCFTRSEVYAKQRSAIIRLEGEEGLLRVDRWHIGLFNHGRWQQKQSSTRLTLDYAYICRGFRGDLESLSSLFHIRTVIFDTSLSESYCSFLIEECRKLKIPYILMPAGGSYSILL